jgi:hypothetical protein
MKLLPVLVALAACQGSPSGSKPQPAAGSAAPAAGSAAPPAAPPMVRTAQVCLDAITVVRNASCGSAAPSLKAAEASLEGTVAAMTKTGDAADPEQYDIICSRMLLALEKDAIKLGCTLPIEPKLRTTMMEKLDRYFAQRTPVTKTGDPAADDLIAKVAAMRDAACACQDQTCLDKLQIPSLPSHLPDAARDLITKLLDDAARCGQRIGMHQ